MLQVDLSAFAASYSSCSAAELSVGHRCPPPLCLHAQPHRQQAAAPFTHPLLPTDVLQGVSHPLLSIPAAPPPGWACPSAPLSWRPLWTLVWPSGAATGPSTRCWWPTMGWQQPSSCAPCGPGRTRTLAASAQVRAAWLLPLVMYALHEVGRAGGHALVEVGSWVGSCCSSC